ncbi:MAG: phosphoenolpyruvate--protein phosphotransferase [Bacteroidales bacterium]|nr:phosphoenolpyruvate--protein phosphotransferase [Bacteroidales bacterium]
MIVSGPAVVWRRNASQGAVRSFDEAFAIVRADLAALAAGNPVFSAHLEMLDDTMLCDAVQEGISSGLAPLDALDAARDGIVAMFEGIDDEYLKARADDVRDVFGRLREAMAGEASGGVEQMPRGSILVAEELLPSDTTRLDFKSLGGILCHKGSSTSHVCIISRAKGVPIQVGVDISGISEGDTVQVDDPLAGCLQSIASRARASGLKVYVNAANLDEIRSGIEAGAEGVGIFRTEFLFLNRSSVPSREEHAAIYKEALLSCGGRPLALRTMDIGGDKQLPYLPVQAEDNPFLGLRGIRFSLLHTHIFIPQLEGALDAARSVRDIHPEWFEGGSPLHLIIPMVSCAVEILQVRDILGWLAPDYRSLLELGIMIETPAAVLDAPALAAESDFFSVGTNDLTQYIMAADRGEAAVAYLYDSFAPAVFKALQLTVAAAHDAKIPVGICGEMASDPRATGILIDLGFDSLSLSRLEPIQ